MHMDDSASVELTFDGPARYRICVRGKILASWSDRLEGMSITVTEAPNGAPVTILTGQLSDQASLTGVLNTLYELHLPVLSVECLSTGRQE
jgi:hypothetical protein